MTESANEAPHDVGRVEQTIAVADLELLQSLFGPGDRHAKQIRRRFSVDMVSRDGGVKLVGIQSSVDGAGEVIQQAIHIYGRDGSLTDAAMRRILDATEPEVAGRGTTADGVEPRSRGQDLYLKALRDHAITFALGPAGTGKTFLAAAMAVSMLRQGRVRRIVLCRPAVEAGEHLGFLPGDFEAKINPYLRPLYDALFALLDVRQVRRYMDSDIIEIAPLAYMRGRTLDKAFVILDEAQNTTSIQMKMFLTRLGVKSRMVVTGDTTQIDLPDPSGSGLVEAAGMLEGVGGIAVIRLQKADIVRHPLVQRIVDAYEQMPGPDAGQTKR